MAKIIIDPDRLIGAGLDTAVSGFLTGFMTTVKKVFGNADKLSKEQWQHLRDDMLLMGTKFKSSQKILGDNLKYLEEQAKTNEKAAKVLETYNQGNAVLDIIGKLERKEEIDKAEMKKLTDAMKAQDSLADAVLNLTIKKSDQLYSMIDDLGENSALSAENQIEIAKSLIENIKTFGLDKNAKVLEGTEIAREGKESVSEVLSRELQKGITPGIVTAFLNAAAITKESKQDETVMMASQLGKLGMGLGKGEYKEKVTDKEEKNLLAMPNQISAGIGAASSLLDQSGEIILLLAILLPFIWKFIADKIKHPLSLFPTPTAPSNGGWVTSKDKMSKTQLAEAAVVEKDIVKVTQAAGNAESRAMARVALAETKRLESKAISQPAFKQTQQDETVKKKQAAAVIRASQPEPQRSGGSSISSHMKSVTTGNNNNATNGSSSSLGGKNNVK